MNIEPESGKSIRTTNPPDIAYHEAGHALVMVKLHNDRWKLDRVVMSPHGCYTTRGALTSPRHPYTKVLPSTDEEMHNQDCSAKDAKWIGVVTVAGHAAERLYYEEMGEANITPQEEEHKRDDVIVCSEVARFLNMSGIVAWEMSYSEARAILCKNRLSLNAVVELLVRSETVYDCSIIELCNCCDG